MDALTKTSESEYEMSNNPEFPSCWITVGNISVYVKRTDEGVVVDLYPACNEAGEALASCYAFSSEAQAVIDATEGIQ